MNAADELPSGTVSLLFTDIEGSTRLLRRLGGERYGEVLSAHRRLLRAAFAEHAGREIDTQGDAFFVAFGRARDAVAAAVAGQVALAGHAWPDGVEVNVRMGIHTGEPAVGDEGYHGLGLHRGARICSAAHGGQIVLSNATRELVEDEPPPGITLRDLGEKRLKDLERPERIFQVEYPGAPTEFPPLKTLDAQPEDTPFGGREAELAAAVAARRWSRRRPALAVLAAAAAATLCAVVAVLLIGGGGASSVVVRAGAVGVFSRDGDELVASVPVGAAPTGIAVGEDGIWVTNTDAQTVSRIDPDTNAAVQTIDVGSGPSGIAVGGHFVWVANSLDGTVSKIDPRKNGGVVLQTIRVGNQPTSIAYGRGGVWVTNSADRTVTRIVPATGAASRPVPTGAGADGIAVADRVWVTSEATGTMTEIDPETARPLQPISVGHGPAAVAVGAGAVWVANALDGTVSKVDPRRASVLTTIPVGAEPRGIAASGGAVWVSDESGTLTKIDPGRGTVVRTVRIGNRPHGVAIASSGVYVAVGTSGAAHRGGTLRLLSLRGPLDSVDPALAYSPLSLPLVSLTGDGLVGFRRVGGTAGGQLVPDLAEAIPAPTADGTTYTFRLRPDLEYSTGHPVRAADLRHAIERTFAIPGSPGPSTYFGGIVGARACAGPPAPCDLSRGIVTDDEAGTVTFHLTAADPDFLYKLALPQAYAVPRSAPAREAPRGLPGTGPYRIAELTRSRLALERNPHFAEWSAAAQPAGYPDRIDLRLGVSPDAQLSAIRRGEADWGFAVENADPAQVRSLPTRYASQVHLNPTRSTDYVFLNTTTPPFTDVRVRRAVNLAVDRRAVARAGQAHPTCQVLPPDFLGYRPYCPFHESAGGDLAAARRLVAASGTRGAAVTVWSPGEDPAQQRTRAVASALRRLGYRVRTHVVHPFPRYLGAVSNPRSRAQAGFYAWSADYPAPSSFIGPQLTCAAPANVAHFCDRALDGRIGRAATLQSTDPQAAGALWAGIDRRITDLAPWVPFSNLTDLDFVSRRVGNYQYNPEWGILFDQLWVR